MLKLRSKPKFSLFFNNKLFRLFSVGAAVVALGGALVLGFQNCTNNPATVFLSDGTNPDFNLLPREILLQSSPPTPALNSRVTLQPTVLETELRAWDTFAYKWFLYGHLLPNEDKKTLVREPLLSQDLGPYQVEISNGTSTVTSQPFDLVIPVPNQPSPDADTLAPTVQFTYCTSYRVSGNSPTDNSALPGSTRSAINSGTVGGTCYVSFSEGVVLKTDPGIITGPDVTLSDFSLTYQSSKSPTINNRLLFTYHRPVSASDIGSAFGIGFPKGALTDSAGNPVEAFNLTAPGTQSCFSSPTTATLYDTNAELIHFVKNQVPLAGGYPTSKDLQKNVSLYSEMFDLMVLSSGSVARFFFPLYFDFSNETNYKPVPVNLYLHFFEKAKSNEIIEMKFTSDPGAVTLFIEVLLDYSSSKVSKFKTEFGLPGYVANSGAPAPISFITQDGYKSKLEVPVQDWNEPNGAPAGFRIKLDDAQIDIPKGATVSKKGGTLFPTPETDPFRKLRAKLACED